ncbi:MAG: cytochrome c biogenesis protein CcsA [Gaiellaceae bacterium]
MLALLQANGPVLAACFALALLGSALGLALLWVPRDINDPAQRIFYIHVPIAITAYTCFGMGAWKALRLLWLRGERYDLESYVAVHQGVIFGALTLITGSLWAKSTWGHWWLWSERQLVLFLILFLFYCAYFMLRYSIEPGPTRANISAVYALLGVALIPVSFLAIRLSEQFIHPVVFTLNGPQMTGSMFFVFCLSLAGMLSLAYMLYRVELAGKRSDLRLRRIRAKGREREALPEVRELVSQGAGHEGRR